MKRKSKGCSIGAIAIVAVAIVAAIAVTIYRYATVGYEGEETRIYVPSSTSAEGLRDSLRTGLGEDYGERVYGVWKKLTKDGVVGAGSYVVRPGEKAWELARRIRNRQQDPVRLTFNNVRTMGQLGELVGSQMMISGEEFLSAVDSVLQSRGVSKAQYPAYFLPDTYEFYWNALPAVVADRLIGYRDRFWNDSREAKAGAMGLTPEQVATIASIVEEESAKNDERPKIARLYINRIKRRMLLQADPTVKFAVGDFSLRRITRDHLKVNSPYNTYLYPGLPPGPIRIVDGRTLDGVLNAPEHDYLFMCAKEDFSGYHNFSTTFEQHAAYARAYRAALDRRGIK